MPSLQVRDLPEEIYIRLQEKAEKEHRSLAQQAVAILAEGLNVSLSNKKRRKDILESFLSNSDEIKNYDLSDPTKMIREDRKR